jgi:hypothetical protein
MYEYDEHEVVFAIRTFYICFRHEIEQPCGIFYIDNY